MACRGVHFALTDEQADRLLEAAEAGDDALMEVVEEIEEAWEREWLAETDKAWDGIHRCLTDGKLEWGDTPLHKCILGRFNLHAGDDYLINLLDPNEVAEVAAAVAAIDRDALRRGYDAIDPESYYYLVRSDSDFEYTWTNFVGLRDFFRKAADAGRAVMFTADQ